MQGVARDRAAACAADAQGLVTEFVCDATDLARCNCNDCADEGGMAVGGAHEGGVEGALVVLGDHPTVEHGVEEGGGNAAAHTRHTSRVTRHTSHVTRYTSHVTRHTQCRSPAHAAESEQAQVAAVLGQTRHSVQQAVHV